jgi:hypothetical protein
MLFSTRELGLSGDSLSNRPLVAVPLFLLCVDLLVRLLNLNRLPCLRGATYYPSVVSTVPIFP